MAPNVTGSGRRLRVVAALASGASLTRAAKAGGISKRTAIRWAADPEFAKAVRAAREANARRRPTPCRR